MERDQIRRIIDFLDAIIEYTGKDIGAVDANHLLEVAGLLKDSRTRKGKPLRDLLRAGEIPHAHQPKGRNTTWIIPSSKQGWGNSSKRI